MSKLYYYLNSNNTVEQLLPASACSIQKFYTLAVENTDYTVNDTNYRQFIAVPRGGRMALLQNFTRSGVSGDYRFDAPGLPPGVRLLADAAPKDLPNVPLVFEAAADAPLGQAVVSLRMLPLDPKQTVVGRMRQVYDIVRNGNVIYYQGVEDRLPVAEMADAVGESRGLEVFPDEDGVTFVIVDYEDDGLGGHDGFSAASSAGRES